jgi:hypothetical protein
LALQLQRSTEGAETLERRLVEESGRFDDDFYVRSYGPLLPRGLSALDHFMKIGHEQGFLASATFDPIVYKILHPLRRHSNALVDSILSNDLREYRDVRAVLVDIAPNTVSLPMRYDVGLREEWKARAHVVAANRDRADRLPFRNGDYVLHNPNPNEVFSRFADDKPFCFSRLPHGYWDVLAAIYRIGTALSQDLRCRKLSERELFNLGVRLLISTMVDGSTGWIEGFDYELEIDLINNPKDEDFWTAIALKGVPTFDDALEGFDERDVHDRVHVLGRFFSPKDKLYDANLWKRWALSGDMARLPDAVRDHPVIVVAPAEFASLGTRWRLPVFRHVSVPPDLGFLLRTPMLDIVGATIATVLADRHERKPVVLLQCTGELSYWLTRRLRPRYPDVFYLDLGQALDLWHWKPSGVWSTVYGDAVRAANPFIEAQLPASEVAEGLDKSWVGDFDSAQAIFQVDYLRTGLFVPTAERLFQLEKPFEPQGTNGWRAALPSSVAPLTDDDAGPFRSPLLLLEDKRTLGRGHDVHADIFERGGGLFSFWKGGVYFSTSDNSDPNVNGRTYEVAGRIDLTAGEMTAADQ